MSYTSKIINKLDDLEEKARAKDDTEAIAIIKDIRDAVNDGDRKTATKKVLELQQHMDVDLT